MELLSFALMLLAASAVAGVIAGLLGVGGGIVIVPALFYVLSSLSFPRETLMHVCVGTSLATIVPTSLRSLRSHHRRGAVDWGLLQSWGPWLAVGAVCGVIAASWLPTTALLIIFGVAALLVALQMAFGGATAGALGSTPPRGAVGAAWASGNGVLSSLMGIGGGTFGVPLLTMYGAQIHQAVATSAGFGVLIAAPSAIGFIISGWGAEGAPPLSLGYVNLIAVAIIVPMTVLCAPLGAWIAHSMNPKPLKMVFALFLVMTAFNMLRKALIG